MEKLLTFEFDNVTREVELIINKIGAKYMIDILENFINNDIDENVELINLVTVRYFKDDE